MILLNFFKKNRFRKEIALALLIKLTVLFLIWEVCFSHPIDHQLKKSILVQHFMMPIRN